MEETKRITNIMVTIGRNILDSKMDTKKFWLLALVFVWMNGCAVAQPANERQEKMDFETLAQTLSDAYPWTLDKVEEIIGTKLESTGSTGFVTLYMAENIMFDEWLEVAYIRATIRDRTQELILIEVQLKRGTLCITPKRINKTYPLPKPTPLWIHSVDDPDTLYTVLQPWGGDVNFAFFNESNGNCLSRFSLRSPNFKNKTPAS